MDLDIKALIIVLGIAFLAGVILFLFNLGTDIKNDYLYKQKVVSQDLALLLDAIGSVDGDIEVSYDFSRDYTINFSNEKECFVSVLDNSEGRTSDIATKSFCIKNKGLGFEAYDFKNPKKLTFVKKNGAVSITSTQSL